MASSIMPPDPCFFPPPPEESLVPDPLFTRTFSAPPPCPQVIDSSEPAQATGSEPVVPLPESRVQVLASGEPLSLAIVWLPETASDESTNFSTDSLSHHYTSQEIRSLWNLKRLYRELATTEQCVQFAEERGLIPREKECRRHRLPMSINKSSGTLGSFRCNKRTCRQNPKSKSRSKGTWFENAHLPLNQLFMLMYLFCGKADYLTVQRETCDEDRETVLSASTIADWYAQCRKTIIAYELEHLENVTQIKENHIEGHWVLGMIENGSADLRPESCLDKETTAKSFVPLGQKHVDTNANCSSDSLPLVQKSVDKKFNRSDSKVLADRKSLHIESRWYNLKRMYKEDHYKGKFTDWLIEYNWRRKIKMNHGDTFEELIKAIRYVYNFNKNSNSTATDEKVPGLKSNYLNKYFPK